MADYVLAIDQGTTSSRAIIFDKAGSIISTGQLEHEQIFPKAGWVEHDPAEIWRNTGEVIGQALGKANPGTTSRPSASRTSARPRWCGIAAPASPCTTRSCGRTPAPSRSSTGSRPTAASSGSRPGGPAARHVLLGHEDRVDPRERARSAREGRGRRPALRHHRHVGALEPHRWRRRGRARDGCHEREPHDVHGPRDAQLGRRHPRRVRRARSMLPEIRSSSEVYGVANEHCCARRRSPASSATSRPRPSARRRSTPARRRTPAPATSSSSTPVRRSCTRGTACSPPSGTSSATSPCTMRWRAPSRSRAR